MPKGKQRRRQRNLGMRSQPTAKGVVRRNKGALNSITVTHKELICDLTSTGVGSEKSLYIINPGRDLVFPWLSRLAACFESYVFNRLDFEFCSSVGTSETGTVSMHPDYDAQDDNTDLTKQELYSFQDSIRMPIWTTATMRCSPKDLRKRKSYFIMRSFEQIGDRLNDCMSLTVNVDSPFVGNIGELWVSYSVVLSTPQLERHGGSFSASIETRFAEEDSLLSDTTKTDGLATVKQNIKGNVTIVEDPSGDSNALQFSKAGRYLLQMVARDPDSAINAIGQMASMDTLGEIIEQAYIASTGDNQGNKTALIDVFGHGASFDMGTISTVAGAVEDVGVYISEVDPTIIKSVVSWA